MSLVEQSDWGKCKAACSTPAVLKPCRRHPHLPLPISPSPSPHWAERRKKRGGNRATKGGNPATTHLCSGGQKQGTLVTVPSTICWLYCPCMHVCMHTHTHTHTHTRTHRNLARVRVPFPARPHPSQLSPALLLLLWQVLLPLTHYQQRNQNHRPLVMLWPHPLLDKTRPWVTLLLKVIYSFSSRSK